jgi:hypothetical protein
MLGTDLLIHAGILAGEYARPNPFLLPPERAFVLIPVGYLSFLILAVLLVWLALRLGIRGVGAGARFGLILGAGIWGALALGLLSISTAPVSLMAGWFAGQTVELAIAGGLLGAARGGVRLRRLWLLTVGWCVLALVIVVVLQNTGYAPVPEIR